MAPTCHHLQWRKNTAWTQLKTAHTMIKKTIEPSIISDSSCVPIQRLHPSKAAFEDWMCHSSMTKTVPFQKLLKTQPWNAAFVSWALHTTNGSFMIQPQTMPRCIAHRLIFFLKRSSDAHFPHVDMILWGLKEKSNIHCLKCINGSVKKKSHFYPVEISSVFSKLFF